MKKFVFGLLATIIFSVVVTGKERGYLSSQLFEKDKTSICKINSNESEFLAFFESQEFLNLTKTFKFSKEQVDLKNYATILNEKGAFNVYRTSVTIGDKINFLTFFSMDKGVNYVVIFEKNNLKDGYFENYDELGGFYSDFRVTKHDSQYQFRINDVGTSIRIGNTIAGRYSCVAHVYGLLKAACSGDEGCDMMCDLNPTCYPMLAVWAVIYCQHN